MNGFDHATREQFCLARGQACCLDERPDLLRWLSDFGVNNTLLPPLPPPPRRGQSEIPQRLDEVQGWSKIVPFPNVVP
jgi:hypothetical protein